MSILLERIKLCPALRASPGKTWGVRGGRGVVGNSPVRSDRSAGFGIMMDMELHGSVAAILLDPIRRQNAMAGYSGHRISSHA